MPKSSMWLVYLMYLCLLAAVHSFDLQTYCLSRCVLGRGGTLCRCTARHFTGKRSDTHAAAEAAAAAANMDVEGQPRRSHGASDNDNEDDNKMHIAGTDPQDLQVLSMNDELISNNQPLYPLLGIVPGTGLQRTNLMGRLPTKENNMGLLQEESVPDDSSSSNSETSRGTLNALSKRYRRYNQEFADGVLPYYKRISAGGSPDNTPHLKFALKKALDNKAKQRILKLLLSKVSR